MTPGVARLRSRAGAGLTLVGAALLVGCGQPPAPEPEVEEPAEPAPPPTDVVVDAAWSPDGQRLAVTWDRGAGARLFGLLGPTRDGEPPGPGTGIPLGGGPGAHATWAPDGLWIAYGARGDIVRARPDGTGPEVLIGGPADDRDPDYAPDGRRLVFVSDRGDVGDRLWVVGAGGGEPTALTGTAQGEAHRSPAWSPTGRVVAYVADEGGTSAVWVANADGSGFGRVGEGSSPDWSPDGARIYFEQNDSIFWRPVEGGTRSFVLADGASPSASPDGRWLSFLRGDPPNVGLWLHDLETSTETRITP